MDIRLIQVGELHELLALYSHLHAKDDHRQAPRLNPPMARATAAMGSMTLSTRVFKNDAGTPQKNSLPRSLHSH